MLPKTLQQAGLSNRPGPAILEGYWPHPVSRGCLVALWKYFPHHLKKFRTKNRYSPWFSPNSTVLDQHKNILWRTALALNSPRDIQLFREVRDQYTQSVRKAKTFFFKQKFASCSTNSKTPRPTALHPLKQLAQAPPASPSPKSSQLMFWKSCKIWIPTIQLG